uniref:Yippee domain-containing protein n=1 Tax=Solanum lycopersicum TaxID=4081 RepID=A0A3Q7HEM8_SOLLC
MGRLFLVHPYGKTYKCKFCDAKLGHVGSLVSKDLEGKTFNCKFCKTKLARADQLITKEISWERFFPNWIVHDAKDSSFLRVLKAKLHLGSGGLGMQLFFEDRHLAI